MEEKIIEKLRKLLAHKESAEKIGSIAEAEAFAARISKLLEQYKLEMADLTFNSAEEEEINREYVDFDELGIPVTNRYDTLLVTLANIVAKANFCLVIGHPKSNRFTLVGKKTDRQIAAYIFNLLYKSSREMAEAEYRKEYYRHKVRGEEWKMKGFKKSWLFGFNQAIFERLRKQEEERTQEQGLVLRSEMEKVVKWQKDNIKTVQKNHNINPNNYTARQKGYAYGQKVGINRAISSNGQPAKRLN